MTKKLEYNITPLIGDSWLINYQFLLSLKNKIEVYSDEDSPSLEQIEDVLIVSGYVEMLKVVNAARELSNFFHPCYDRECEITGCRKNGLKADSELENALKALDEKHGTEARL